MVVLVRDIKPLNVLIDGQGVAKLCDFGLGREGDSSNGSMTFGHPPGTPGYIAPECILQQPYGTSADIYSYGVLAWVLLTGGVTNQSNPSPPIGSSDMRHFRAFADDVNLLDKCLSEPEANHAVRLAPVHQDFVAMLVKAQPGERASHQAIRESELLQPLSLPSKDAHHDAVQAWLAS